MANIKSQKKRIRTNEAARMRNKAVKSELKTLTKHVQSAVAEDVYKRQPPKRLRTSWPSTRP